MEFVFYHDWGSLPENASALFAKAEKESIFFSRPWFEILDNNSLDEGHSMLLACVVDDDSVLAILPLIRRTNETLQSLRNRHTPQYSLLIADQDQSEIIDCLAEGLSRLPFQALRLEPIAEKDSNLSSLQLSMESRGFSCQRYFRIYNWIHQLSGQSYEDYMAQRPAWLRNTIARKRRKLEREQGFEIRLFTGDDLEQAKADYNAIYQASWKANELIEGFLERLLKNMSASGWLRLAILYISGRPAAAQIWFVAHGKASIFRLVYDDAWKRYSPGTILTDYLVKYVIDVDRVEEIDFLTGNDAYKQDWMSVRRERWALVFIRDRETHGRGNPFVESLQGLLKRFRG